MAKQFLFDSEGRRELENGVSKLAKAVRVTLGPKGRNVLLEKQFGNSVITKDGATVSKEVELAEPFANLGAKLVNEAAARTNKEVGDGTTTSVILTDALLRQGRKYVTSGVSPIALRRGIEKAVDKVEQTLSKLATPISGKKDLQNVATMSSNQDIEIGKLVAEALTKVGERGVVTVEESEGVETHLEFVDGMEFDKGYLSPYFITNPGEKSVEYEDPYLVITDGKISSMQDIVPLLEQVLPTRKPLYIVAEDVDGDALAGLIINRLRGVLEVVVTKAPGFGDRRKAMLEDLAVLTGGAFLSKDLGLDWSSVTLDQLGRCKRIEVTKDRTIFFKGQGKKAQLEERRKQLESQIEQTKSSYDREKLEERLAKIEGKIAVIKVGGMTESVMKERKDRVDDALASTRAAVEEGIVPGAGTAYIRAIKAVNAMSASGDEKFGVQLVAEALRAPLSQLGDNAGFDGPAIVAEVEEAKGSFGFNAVKGEVVDLNTAGIFDAVKVLRVALRNASSVAALNLVSDTLVADIPKGEEIVPGAVS